MASLLTNGAKVSIRRTRSGRRMNAFINGVAVGPVRKIKPADDGVGWVYIRVPLQNCVIEDERSET